MDGTAQAPMRGELERVVVTTGDGRVFDLGNPNKRIRFWLRVQHYKLRRKING